MDNASIIIAPEFSRRQVGTLLRWTLRLLDRLTADELGNAAVFTAIQIVSISHTKEPS
jgi:hypothetical protein